MCFTIFGKAKIGAKEGGAMCDWKGSLRYELLPSRRTIHSELYCRHLPRLQQEIFRQKNLSKLVRRKGAVFHYINQATYIFSYPAKI